MMRDEFNPFVLFDEGSQPPREFADALQRSACVQCQCTVHIASVRLSATRSEWRPSYFHDEACPTLAAVRADASGETGRVNAAAVERRLVALGFTWAPRLGELVEYEPPSSEVYDLEPVELRQS